jgi:hypothetical protein
MEFIVMEGTKIARVSAHSESEAAAKYARRQLAIGQNKHQVDLKVVPLREAQRFACKVNRSDDASIECVARRVS